MSAPGQALLIEHHHDDGTMNTFRFTQHAGQESVRVVIDDIETEPHTGNLLDVAGIVDQALHAGPGVLTLCAEGLSEAKVLARLTFGEQCDLDAWEEWSEFSELDENLETIYPEAYSMGRWRITSNQGDDGIRVLTDGDHHHVARWQPDSPFAPTTWEPMFSWSFSNETGGPCIMDGSCTAGLLAPGTLLEVERGDQNPGSRLYTFEPHDLLSVLVDSASYWELPLIMSHVGFPGLSKQELDELWKVSTDNTQEFTGSSQKAVGDGAGFRTALVM